jgi:hypothetical protein
MATMRQIVIAKINDCIDEEDFDEAGVILRSYNSIVTGTTHKPLVFITKIVGVK